MLFKSRDLEKADTREHTTAVPRVESTDIPRNVASLPLSRIILRRACRAALVSAAAMLLVVLCNRLSNVRRVLPYADTICEHL